MRTILLVLVATFASRAAADNPPRYHRAQHVAIDVKLSDRVKPVQPQTPPPAAPVGAEALLAGKRDALPVRVEQEAVLEKLVRDTPEDDPEKPDLMFRLAELYAQQQRFWRLEAIGQTLRSRQSLPAAQPHARQVLP
jgi:hypothetical protein